MSISIYDNVTIPTFPNVGIDDSIRALQGAPVNTSAYHYYLCFVINP